MNIIPILLDSTFVASTAEDFVKLDPYGVGMAVMAMTVVLIVLTFAAILFQNQNRIIGFFTELFTKKDKALLAEPVVKEKVSTSGDEIAAIAMALHIYQSDLHDTESLTLTINKISRTYSPWSSKIYGVMNTAVKRTPYSK